MKTARARSKAADCCPTSPKASAKATRPFVGLCKALGDETRLEILGMLASRTGELCACEIESHFELSQPTISHHLRILREVGLIRAERRGTWVYYALERPALARLSALRALLEN